MRWRCPFALFPFAMAAAGFAMAAEDAPLPDAQHMKQRALASMSRSEKDLEKYSCVAREMVEELNSDGSVKHVRSKEEEQFFVNGVEIKHTLQRDGRALTADAARKEQQKVDQEVKKYSDANQAQKFRDKEEKQVDMFLRAVRLSNGHREVRVGRSTVVYRLGADPSFRPAKLEERFAQALVGNIWLDEETGNVAELRVETDHDVKIGGGLVANVHKGFRLHLVQERQPDGVWLTKAMDGSGDARAGLFLHPRFRFRRQMGQCHLFSVDTKQMMYAPDESGAAKK